MARGIKTGGRKRGTPNKRTMELRALAAGAPAADTPLEFLSGVYRDDALPMALRVEAAGRAAPYVHPRLATVAVTGAEGRDLIPEHACEPQRLAQVLLGAPHAARDGVKSSSEV
jgi:hypothetical protein